MMHDTSQIINTELQPNVTIGPFCQIGYPAEKKGFYPDIPFGVVIKEGAVLHGLVTVDAGTWRETVIGERVWLMKKVHVGHDALIHEDVTISPMASIGGHVEIGRSCIIGMGVMIHPRQKIPPHCVLGMGSILTKRAEMRPFEIWAGNPAKYIKMNEVGIEKAGLTQAEINDIIEKWYDENSK